MNTTIKHRHDTALAFGIACAVAMSAAGVVSAQQTPQAAPVASTVKPDSPNPASPNPASPNPGSQNPGSPNKVGEAMEKVGNAAERVVEAPLKDLNIIKPKRQPVLEAVMENPYSLAGLAGCSQYRAEIAKLTGVLGPDVDSPEASAPDRKESRAEFALGAGEAVASSFIPGGGLLRKISGADKRQKLAAAAVYAGTVRRSYLKGLMLGKNCRR